MKNLFATFLIVILTVVTALMVILCGVLMLKHEPKQSISITFVCPQAVEPEEEEEAEQQEDEFQRARF